jgi:uncharacterized protein (DUF1800 family)
VYETYQGAFGVEQATRLLWRAGFGPANGQAKKLAELGVQQAVRSLTRPGPEKLVGPKPHDDDNHPLAPYDAWGHDHLWWLDRMVRTTTPLVERMTLVWHDWFATSNDGVGNQRLMLQQNELLRRRALGSFHDLLLDVTKDPAMLVWLNGTDNSRESPNENFAREMMELFTLGAGHGNSERDVREQARALTGWRNDWKDNVGLVNFRYDPTEHDPDVKRIFGKAGRFDWKGACELCLKHPAHPSFLVSKLWSYFVPTDPDVATRRALERMYAQNGWQVRPLVEAILTHPAFYEGPRMVKPPVVQVAGMLRALGRGVDTDSWSWIADLMGQKLFFPPNVSGWDDTRWLDTATFRGRWIAAQYALDPRALDPSSPPAGQPSTADGLVASALGFWGDPALSAGTRAALTSFAQAALATANENWKRKQWPPLIENALRQLIAVSPDLQTA